MASYGGHIRECQRGELGRVFSDTLGGCLGNVYRSYASSAISILQCRQRDAYPTKHKRIVGNMIWLEFFGSMRKRMTSWTGMTPPAKDGCSLSDFHFHCRSNLQQRRPGLDEGMGRGVRNSPSYQCLIDRPTSSTVRDLALKASRCGYSSRGRLIVSSPSIYGGFACA